MYCCALLRIKAATESNNSKERHLAEVLPDSAADEGASPSPEDPSRGMESDSSHCTEEKADAQSHDERVSKMDLSAPQDWGNVLQEYKRSLSQDIQNALQDRRDEIQQAKKRIKELALQINAEKHRIDQVSSALTKLEFAYSDALSLPAHLLSPTLATRDGPR